MSKTIAEYAASPIADAYETLKKEFQVAKKFKENATQGKLPPKSSAPKPSGMAYLVLAGTVVTLLVPLKIVGCLVSLLLNYAYLPVTLIVVGLILLLRKIGCTEKKSTAEFCMFLVGFWPLLVSDLMAEHTTAKNTTENTVYLDKLHFPQVQLADFWGT